MYVVSTKRGTLNIQIRNMWVFAHFSMKCEYVKIGSNKN